MRCPLCEKEIPGTPCPECGETVPEGGRYCLECGTKLEKTAQASSEPERDEFDLEERVLCPDGTCTGIIVNGKCTECGKTLTQDRFAEQGREVNTE